MRTIFTIQKAIHSDLTWGQITAYDRASFENLLEHKVVITKLKLTSIESRGTKRLTSLEIHFCLYPPTANEGQFELFRP